jgi:hypothetical protein
MNHMSDELDGYGVARIIEVFNRCRVAYVVTGDVAGEAWASSVGVDARPAWGIELTPDTEEANLGRVSAALYELYARIRANREFEGAAFEHDAAALVAESTWNLVCPAGPFDLVMVPPDAGGYTGLAGAAVVVAVEEEGGERVEAPLADLADVIRLKEVSGGPDNLEVLPALREALHRRNAATGNKAGRRTTETREMTFSYEIEVVSGEEGEQLRLAQAGAIRDLLRWIAGNRRTK